MDKSNITIIWAENAGMADILLFALKSRFANIRVNYDRSQICPSAARLIGIMERAGVRGVFRQVELTLHKVDAKGLALTYRVDKELNACLEDFISRHIPYETKRYKDMLKSYLAGSLKSKAIFIAMAASEIDPGEANAGETNVIYLEGHPLSYLLCRFYSGRGYVVRSAFGLMTGLKYYIRPLYYLAYYISCKLRPGRVKGNISDIRPAIWAEYYPSHIHNFWMDKINADGFDIVAYLDRSDTPAIKETVSEIEGRGIKWIDAQAPSLIKMSRLGLSGFLRMAGRLFFVPVSNPVWLGILRFEYDFYRSIYESVFRRYKVRILIQHQEASWRQEAQAIAVERAGGIMVGYHWSVYTSYLLPTHFFPQHVYFVWGKYMSELLRKKGSACRHVLPSGISIIPNGRNPERKDMFAKGTDFVISVFDDSAGERLFNSPGSLSEFYVRVLKIVESNPGIGCIIKSKQPLDQSLPSVPSGREILDKIEALKGGGRLAVLDPSVSPLVAASCSDLCVGYGINSACAIAAIVGNCASINWGCSGLMKHPFYRYSGGKVIFQTLDEVEEAVLKAREGDKTVGDYGRLKKQVNYFEDLSAVSRITGFMETYMKARSGEAGDPERSLEFAAKKYLDDNYIGEDYFRKDDIWEDE
ncbi:MAG: hypothetical protein WC369_08990 [Dehalococcoidales bacterium]